MSQRPPGDDPSISLERFEPEYSIRAIRYATLPDMRMSDFVPGAQPEVKLDLAMVFWLITGPDRTILFDCGFHRDTFLTDYPVKDYLRPDEALKLASVAREAVTDVVISHAHWDHMGGLDLFPMATVWIQKAEYLYYTLNAWQPGGQRGGIDPEDVQALLRLNIGGRVCLIDGDDVELFPGIRAYTGARHTHASQYLRIGGARPFVLASDNCYFYYNLSSNLPSAPFCDADTAANVAALSRMVGLAGARDRVVPGHDALQFEKYPRQDRVATIK